MTVSTIAPTQLEDVMSIQIPSDPDIYFREFFPEQFRKNRNSFPSGTAAAATRFKVTGVGAWTHRAGGAELAMLENDDPDIALELECKPEDFDALFVGYGRAEVKRSGKITESALAALRPLVLTEKKYAVCKRTEKTLALALEHDRADRTLLVTPGGGGATTPACTVSLSFDNYLKIQTGKQSTTWLFVSRKLRVKGDLAHAALLDPLLG